MHGFEGGVPAALCPKSLVFGVTDLPKAWAKRRSCAAEAMATYRQNTVYGEQDRERMANPASPALRLSAHRTSIASRQPAAQPRRPLANPPCTKLNPAVSATLSSFATGGTNLYAAMALPCPTTPRAHDRRDARGCRSRGADARGPGRSCRAGGGGLAHGRVCDRQSWAGRRLASFPPGCSLWTPCTSVAVHSASLRPRTRQAALAWSSVGAFAATAP